MERYLIEQYDVFEDEEWLTSEGDIEEYFDDYGRDLMECGQGFYEDEAEIICKIGDKFYNVTIYAEIASAKQDRGDRLYWVERISKVSYKEIPKPVPIATEEILYSIIVTDEQKELLERFMNENYIKYVKVQ